MQILVRIDAFGWGGSRLVSARQMGSRGLEGVVLEGVFFFEGVGLNGWVFRKEGVGLLDDPFLDPPLRLFLDPPLQKHSITSVFPVF